MTVLLLSAWLMGFVGSTHCIGMCGPLAMSLPISGNSVSERIAAALIYNLGRITTYAFFGSLIGIAQKLFLPFVFQSQLSIIMGVLLLLLSVYFLIFRNGRIVILNQSRFYKTVIDTLGKLYRKSGYGSLYFIGLLNGLLPCGLVYLALATAFATGSMHYSVLFMTFFGLGTLPAMWAIAFFAHLFSPGIRSFLRKLYPFLYLFTGCLLIWRGLQGNEAFCDMVQMACRK